MSYIDLDVFARENNVKQLTVLRRIKDIPGAFVVEKREFQFLKGTRYPYKRLKRVIVANAAYMVLDALNHSKYIDYTYVGRSKNDFDLLLSELARLKYISRNESENHFGANRYSITVQGAQALDDYKYKRKLELINVTGTAFQVLLPKART